MSGLVAAIEDSVLENSSNDASFKTSSSTDQVYYPGDGGKITAQQRQIYSTFFQQLYLQAIFSGNEHVTNMPATFIGADGMTVTSMPKNVPLKDTTACALPSGMKKRILAQPGFPHPIPSPTSPAHRIAPVKGAGLGMFATRAISAGDVIFAERALLITPQSNIVVPVSPEARGTREDAAKRQAKYREELVTMLLDRMAPENAAAYRALVNSHTDGGYGPLAGIFETNSWEVSTAEMRKAISGHLSNPFMNISGVCDTLSRVNHSCSPNARVDFDIASFSFVLRAVRAIPADAEVTVTYIYTEKVARVPAAQRQEELGSYGFTCTCAACSAPAISDPRRAELAASQVPVFRRWLETPSVSADRFIRESERVLQLVADEGLEGGKAYLRHLEQLLNVYAALGDREKCIEVGRRVALARESMHGMRSLRRLESRRGISFGRRALGRLELTVVVLPFARAIGFWFYIGVSRVF